MLISSYFHFEIKHLSDIADFNLGNEIWGKPIPIPIPIKCKITENCIKFNATSIVN